MNPRHRFFLFSLLLILAVYLPFFLHFERWETNIISGGDSWGYYAYLPALFIHQDLDSLDRSVAARRQYHDGFYRSEKNALGLEEVQEVDGGKMVIKYTMGVALLNLPAFAVGHAVALLTGYPADGYSPPYIWSVHLYVFLVFFLGLFVLNKVLVRYVSGSVAALTLLVLALATNLFFFVVYNGPMAHVYIFTLHSILLYATIRWYESQRLVHALLVGFSAGLITLMRPTELIFVLVPLLYGLENWKDLGERLRFIWRHYEGYLWAAVGFLSCGVPQMIYWKWLTGSFLFYSYGEEGFDFLNPNILKGLLSYNNGWLAYTPVMVLALLGIVLVYRQRSFFWPLIVVLPIHIYIIYSWWCWNYIAGFGSRPMIDIYPLLAIPLALMLGWLFRRKVLALITAMLLVFFAFLNISNTEQLYRGVLWSEDANAAYYWRMLGRIQAGHLDLMVLDNGEWLGDTSRLKPLALLYEQDFETPQDSNFVAEPVFAGRYAYRMPRDYSPYAEFHATAEELGAQPGDWIRFRTWGWKLHHHQNLYNMATLVVTIDRGSETRKWSHVRMDNKLGNDQWVTLGGRARQWGEVVNYTRLPADLQPGDRIGAHLWNPTGNTFYLDELKVELLRPMH